MVRRCAWGTCNMDCRYPERMGTVKFHGFPNPRKELSKCLRWIKACGKPPDQLNLARLNHNKAVCSRHFVGGNGPTTEFPDPLPADGSTSPPSSPPPKRMRLEFDTPEEDHKYARATGTDEPDATSMPSNLQRTLTIMPLDAMAQIDEGTGLEEMKSREQLQEDNEKLRRTLLEKEKQIKLLTDENLNLKRQLHKQQPFTV